MIEMHLYGKLRRFARDQDPTGYSIIHVPVQEGDTIQGVLEHLGVPMEEVGSNIFLNWQYSALTRKVEDGDRLAVFPDDMQLLYKWYFVKVGREEDDRG
ncbi:MAG: hypothetical protein E3J21_12415 [Anaerolineales bacterium]|nr:MAG: hypothetical protein E3J21_12415 [Anaerolineales bacterium]